MMFISQYMLIPVLPVAMAKALGLSINITGVMWPVAALGMILIGPFCSYLMDLYNRKTLCALSFIVLTLSTIGYTLIHSAIELFLLCFIQGVAFGMATTSLITLGIDVSVSQNRSKGNVAFGWLTRLGMLWGIALGATLYLNFDFKEVLVCSVALALVGVLSIAKLHIPFRAPIGSPVCTLDRFFLPHTSLFMLNTMLISFAVGMLLPLIHVKLLDTFLLKEFILPYFVCAAIAFTLSAFLLRTLHKMSLGMKAIIGIMAIVGAIGHLLYLDSLVGLLLSAVLVGIGVGLVTPMLLFLFIGFSSHCQRGTANTTHLLAWEVGGALGVALSCGMMWHYSSHTIFYVGLLLSILALLLFITVSYPYYMKKKVR